VVVIHTQFLFIRLYRVYPGDVDVSNVPIGADEDYEAIASERLLSYFNDDSVPARERPHHADVVDEGGNVLVRLMVKMNRQVQRVIDSPARA
jgi:hypothetical protein